MRRGGRLLIDPERAVAGPRSARGAHRRAPRRGARRARRRGRRRGHLGERPGPRHGACATRRASRRRSPSSGRACRRRSALPYGLPPRAAALALLEGDEELVSVARRDRPAAASAERAALAVPIAAERHAAAARHRRGLHRGPSADVAGRPIAGGGDDLAAHRRCPSCWPCWPRSSPCSSSSAAGSPRLLTSLWTATASPAARRCRPRVWSATAPSAARCSGASTAASSPPSAVGIPYILTFYFVLALLEDSGYMNAAAFLADRVMHLFGLHGRAVIPLMAAAGCNVPADHGHARARHQARAHHRLRARRAGALQRAHGRHPRARSRCSSAGSGRSSSSAARPGGAHRRPDAQPLLPGEPEGLVMEMFPFRRPSLRLVAGQDLEALRRRSSGRPPRSC